MRAFFTIAVICVCLALCGCNGTAGDSTELVPVSGKVTIDGQPASGVTVLFVPVGSTAGQICYGTTGADGHYEIKADEQRTGAPVGDFKVTFSKLTAADGSELPAGSPPPPDAAQQIPAKYTDQALTPTKATVPAAGGTFDFDVKSK